MIPVSKPVINKDLKKNVNLALDEGWISSRGRFIELFEKKLKFFLIVVMFSFIIPYNFHVGMSIFFADSIIYLILPSLYLILNSNISYKYYLISFLSFAESLITANNAVAAAGSADASITLATTSEAIL